jgi:FdhD protein
LLYKHTGVTHSAAFASRDDLSCFAEDLYQMPAVYKILGQAVLEDKDHDIMIVSGRVDLAMVSAAVGAGVKILISRTGVTDKAFDFSSENGLTIVGFARGLRFNMYTHSDRIRV